MHIADMIGGNYMLMLKKTCKRFCKLLRVFATFYFILLVRAALSGKEAVEWVLLWL